MRKASTRLPEQGTQTPSPAPDLIPAETKNQPRTYIRIGTANGVTSIPSSHQLTSLFTGTVLGRGFVQLRRSYSFSTFPRSIKRREFNVFVKGYGTEIWSSSSLHRMLLVKLT